MEAWAGTDGLFEEWHDSIEIPLLGDVAAGEPYAAFPVEDMLAVPATLWGGRKVFALRVRGSSMIDEGIHHGDYLIVEPREVAENGQTVVAEVDGCVTVKKLYREADGAVRLQPANSELLPLIVRGSQIRIIGVVTGVLRKMGFSGARRPNGEQPRRRSTRAPSRQPRRSAAAGDSVPIDLEVNAIDAQIERWNEAMAQAKRDRRLRSHVGQMAELGRDLTTLRDWCARTEKPSLRRALLVEAAAVMRRMQRFANVTAVRLPDLVLH
jgi:repressor LexA